MSRLEQLIQQHCPNGVEYKTLEEVCEFRAGWGFPEVEQGLTEGKYPFYKVGDMNNSEMFMDTANNYISEETSMKLKCKPAPKGTIIFPKIGATMNTNKKRILTKPSCYDNNVMGLIAKSVNDRFLYYFFSQYKLIDFAKGTGAVPSLDTNRLKKLLIPVPPLPVQEEIVRILDTLTELQAELQAELQKRLQQYNYYRDKLLSFNDLNGGGYAVSVEWKKLGDIATDWYRGAGIKRDEVSEEGTPCIRYGEIHTTYNIWFDECVSHTDENKQPAKKYADYGDILFAITSEDMPFIGNSVAYIGKERILVGGDIVVMKHTQNPKYMSYVLSTSDAVMQKGKGKVKSKVVHTNVPSLKEIVVPIPSLEEQERIATILDKFYALTTDITAGLPAEIEARRKQYEYYRDQLLTFKQKA